MSISCVTTVFHYTGPSGFQVRPKLPNPNGHAFIELNVFFKLRDNILGVLCRERGHPTRFRVLHAPCSGHALIVRSRAIPINPNFLLSLNRSCPSPWPSARSHPLCSWACWYTELAKCESLLRDIQSHILCDRGQPVLSSTFLHALALFLPIPKTLASLSLSFFCSCPSAPRRIAPRSKAAGQSFSPPRTKSSCRTDIRYFTHSGTEANSSVGEHIDRRRFSASSHGRSGMWRFGKRGVVSIDPNFQPLIMTVQAPVGLVVRQGSTSIGQNFQPVSMAVQTANARRWRGTKMRKFVEEPSTSICYDLSEGLSSSLERGGPQLSRTALNQEKSSVGRALRASTNRAKESHYDPPRQGFLCVKELPIGSACGNGDIKCRWPPQIGNRHFQGIIVLDTNRLPKENNGEKNIVPKTNGRDLERQTLQFGRAGVNIHMPNASTTSEAIAILKNRQQQGIIIESYTFVEVLKLCLQQKDLIAARQMHDFIIQSGMHKNPYVATTLLNVYIRCGRLRDARRVFDALQKKTVVTWNSMIAGYAKNDHAENALEVFNQMRQGGAQPGGLTCLSILKACASPLALKCGKEVHVYIRHAGLESDVRVGTALIQMYAKCGSIAEARRVFEKLGTNRDVFTWNVMIGAYAESSCGIEAYQVFLQMQREGFIRNTMTYVSILNASASAGALEWVKDVHSHAVKAGLESDLRVSNALVHMYAKSGSIDDARLIFDRLKTRDVITWNMMIGAYAESGCGVEAYRLFLHMQREGFIPDAITYVSILNASASAGASEWVKDVHSHACKAGLETDLRVGSVLVHMYAKSGSIDDALLIFERLKTRDVITWNMMIGAYSESGCCVEAYRLFLKMQREGFTPDAITYVSILNACAGAGAGALEWVKDVHSHAIKAGTESDLRVGTALVRTYAKCGSIDDALLIFERMKIRDVITWSLMIGAYAESGCGVEAYRLFLQMKREGFKPDAVTYVSILNASGSAGALDWVKEVHSHALKEGLESDLRVGTALVHMYAKSGSIGDAQLVFERMERRDVVTWTAMIRGLAQHGCGHEALDLFRKMNAACVRPNGATFVAVLSACCHSGLLDEGRRLFLAMTQNYDIEPTVVHYNCMVDLLGRAGHLEETKAFIGDMPVEPDVVTWGALLGACRTFGNVELGELAAKELLKLEPQNASAYVLLSNIYAAAGKWEKVSLVRTMMQERGVRKERGRSWIEVDNKIHDFVVGDTSHPESKAIYAELKKLTDRLKAQGYVPDTQVVLHNIDEEDKELALCSHSEKLAIVYGLMRTPGGKPIRVYKNLRVCSDCHTLTKFISKLTGREIMARDANRFHYFKDGVCSCGDHW